MSVSYKINITSDEHLERDEIVTRALRSGRDASRIRAFLATKRYATFNTLEMRVTPNHPEHPVYFDDIFLLRLIADGPHSETSWKHFAPYLSVLMSTDTEAGTQYRLLSSPLFVNSISLETGPSADSATPSINTVVFRLVVDPQLVSSVVKGSAWHSHAATGDPVISFSSEQSTQEDILNVLNVDRDIQVQRITAAWDGDASYSDADGSRFLRTAAPIPSVRAAAVDKNGALWAATVQGLYRCTDKSFEQVVLNKRRPYQRGLQAVAVTGDVVWCGGSVGLYKILTDGTIIKQNGESRENLPSRSVRSLAADGDGGLWIGTGKGLVHRTADGFQSPVYLPEYSVSSLYVDPDGLVAVAQGNYQYKTFRIQEDGALTELGTTKKNLKRKTNGNIEFSDQASSFRENGIGGIFTTSHEPSNWSVRISGGKLLHNNNGVTIAIDCPSRLSINVEEVSTNGPWVAMYGPQGALLVNTSQPS